MNAMARSEAARDMAHEEHQIADDHIAKANAFSKIADHNDALAICGCTEEQAMATSAVEKAQGRGVAKINQKTK
jgi:hypothetical protein